MAFWKKATESSISPGAHPEGWGQDTEFADLNEAIKRDLQHADKPEQSIDE